jgi:hypothetical protein
MNESIEYGSTQFEIYWKETELMRVYDGTLPTFKVVKLPYVLITPHESESINIVLRGEITINNTHFILPPGYEKKVNIMPNECEWNIDREFYINEDFKSNLDESKLENVIEKYAQGIDNIENVQTGLIICPCPKGVVASLRRYYDHIMTNSIDLNKKEAIEKLVDMGRLSIDWLL